MRSTAAAVARAGVRTMATGKDVRFGAEVCPRPRRREALGSAVLSRPQGFARRASTSACARALRA